MDLTVGTRLEAVEFNIEVSDPVPEGGTSSVRENNDFVDIIDSDKTSGISNTEA